MLQYCCGFCLLFILTPLIRWKVPTSSRLLSKHLRLILAKGANITSKLRSICIKVLCGCKPITRAASHWAVERRRHAVVVTDDRRDVDVRLWLAARNWGSLCVGPFNNPHLQQFTCVTTCDSLSSHAAHN